MNSLYWGRMEKFSCCKLLNKQYTENDSGAVHFLRCCLWAVMDEYAGLMLSAMVQQMNVNQYYRYGSNIPEQCTTIQQKKQQVLNKLQNVHGKTTNEICCNCYGKILTM